MSNQFTKIQLGRFQSNLETAINELEQKQIISRIWEHDFTVWNSEPTEITNRLGWLDIAERIRDEIPRLTALKHQLRNEGYTHVLLLGMGGSSLAPEVFSKTFHQDVTGLDLAVLDSTDPGAVIAHAARLELHNTLFIVATKSGSTVETRSFFNFFYNKVLNEVGSDQAGSHFIAITDPGSKLETLARQLNFREIFLNDPNIGGRFSVMSFFGMVPAALIGLDLARLIDRTIKMARSCAPQFPVDKNPGALLGGILGALNPLGYDKVTFVIAPGIASFGDWVEQLIAESTGKQGKGILPVVGEELGAPNVYLGDRIFVHISLKEDVDHPPALKNLANAGHPIIYLQLSDKYDLGAQFFLWEFATAIAGYFLQINPFDQPNVESAKVLARKMVAEYQNTGKLPEADSSPLNKESLEEFISGSSSGSYISLQAYLTPTPEAFETLTAIRLMLRDKYHKATTLGFGPRFLHSTGQLHKGDAGRGLFIQIASQTSDDIPIPDIPGSTDSAMSFQTLKTSQALGDGAALEAAGRKLIRFKINNIQDLDKLT